MCDKGMQKIHSNMSRFIPVRDIKSYVDGLKKEGFHSEEKIEQIRKKHEDALKKIVPNAYPKKNNDMEYKEYVKGHDDFYTKLEVTRNGKVKFKIIFPFRELNEWKKTHGIKDVPPEIIVRCLYLNGASKTYCECTYNSIMRTRSFIKKL